MGLYIAIKVYKITNYPSLFSSNLALISANAPKSPKVDFSTLLCIVFTAFLVFSVSSFASFLATSFSSWMFCSQILA